MSLVDGYESIFGRLVSGYDVEQWVVALLKRWSGTYLSEVERQHGYAAGHFQRVRGWVLAPSFDKWPEDQVPGVLVVSPGLVPPPERRGDGVYEARWRVDVGVLCGARTQQEAHELAMLYLAAHKAIVVQRPGLEGHAIYADWLDESYDPLGFDDTRALYAGRATFTIGIPDVVTTAAGPLTPDDPLEPDTDPWADWPLVETHEETVENYATTAPLPQEDTDG